MYKKVLFLIFVLFFQGVNAKSYTEKDVTICLKPEDAGKLCEKTEDAVKLGKNLINGTISSYYESGKVKWKGNVKNGVLDGLYEAYYENGTVSVEEYYQNGKAEGEMKSYFENGHLESIKSVVHGKNNGPAVLYFQNGNEHISMNFKDHFLDGELKIYYENGTLKEKGNYKNGKPHGMYVTYYPFFGNVEQESFYEDGKLDGIQKGFFWDNSKKFEILFKNDEPISGYFYDNITHRRVEMTPAHLYNYKKDLFKPFKLE